MTAKARRSVRILVLAATAVGLFGFRAEWRGRRDARQIVLAMSRFDITFDKNGKKVYTPGDAQVWTLQPRGNWVHSGLTDRESNVIHKALPYDVDGDGQEELVVVGGTKASIKFYRYKQGQWQAETIWKPDLVRVRDIEFGDVDADGQAEFVVATHDRGGVYVFDRVDGKWTPTQIYGTPDRSYVHEIEIGDVDGDGIAEIFANPSQPNVDVGIAQPGKVVMFRWDGQGYAATVLEDMADTHAKELLVADLYGTGRPVLIAAIEGIGHRAENGDTVITRPCQLKEFRWSNGRVHKRVIAQIPDMQVRTLWPGDADNDGTIDIVAGAKLEGLFLIKRKGMTWTSHLLDADACSAVHAVFVGDVDGDGKNEILSAADFDGRVDLYRYLGCKWTRQTVVRLPKDHWVWTIYQGDVE